MSNSLLAVSQTHRGVQDESAGAWFSVGRHLARRETSSDEGYLEFFLAFYRRCWPDEFGEEEFKAGWLDMRGERTYASNARG